MCNCVNVEIGSYKNQVVLEYPEHMQIYKTKRVADGLSSAVNIDTCLEKEIKELWSKGIKTTGCCCGHNKTNGFIGVFFEDIPKMKVLGYTVFCNNCRPNDEDSFIPKSIETKECW